VAGGVVTKGLKQWIPANDYLFNQEALSRVFRGKFMQRMRYAVKAGALKLADDIYGNLKSRMYAKNWVVSVREPVKQPERVLEYLARYTHRVAIANSRIQKLENSTVTFTVKNRKKHNTETVNITAVEFIRRFLLHSLPKGFVRIRHYGFLANRNRNENLNVIRRLMGVSGPCENNIPSIEEMMLQLTGMDITICPSCLKGKMQLFGEIPKVRAGPQNHMVSSMK
jgi:hypothetical protein